MKRTLLLVLFAAACGPEALDVDTTTQGVGTGTFSELTGFGSNPGGLKAFSYVPTSAPANAPLVLALHACSQTATEYRKAGWEELADQWGFYVLYPEQQTNNNALRCFNWAGEFGDPTNLTRGEGENQSIKQMVDTMVAAHGIDTSRIYLSGHSGGAAQVALMLATWPELFAGGAMIAGIPYNCTTTFTEVSTCLNPGIDRTAMEWGDRARAGNPGYNGPWPKVSIWHGSADSTVRPLMSNEILEQWTNVHGIDTTADSTDTVDGHTREVHTDNSGQPVVEMYTLQGMGHGTPVVPGSNCGEGGAFFLDVGICAAQRIGEFFGLDGNGPMQDRTPPTVNVTAPTDGQTIMGVATITIDASDDVGVDRVELMINGNAEATLTTAPYQHTWMLAGLPNGNYAIRATAYDAAGNSTVDDDTTVIVTGGVNDTTPPTVSFVTPTDGAMVSGAVELTANATDDFGVAKVEYEVGGTKVGESTAPPYSVTWNAPEGPHTLLARAIDAAGNSGEAMIMVTATAPPMGDTTPPTVTITNPTDGATVGGLITATADATDDVEMRQVLLFLDDELIAADYSAPYEFLWNLNDFPEGPHTVSARAFDTSGNLGMAMVSITIEHAAIDPDGTSEPVLLGKKRWGCSTAPGRGDALLWCGLLVVALAFTTRRKR